MFDSFNVCLISIFVFSLSALLTLWVRRQAIKKNILDIPNARSSHVMPTPRGGGIAIVIIWYVFLVVFLFNDNSDNTLIYALLSGLPLAVISFLDDIFDLSPNLRIGVQLLSVLLALYFLGGLGYVNFFSLKIESRFILLPIVAIGFLWFINLYNFLDGIDAYASIEAIMITLVIYFFTGNYLLLIFIAAILGFLIWNWPKAKIFMGDVGSTQLGFTLFIFAIYFHNSGEFDIYNWLIMSSLFWFDATITLLRRLKNKEKISQAHKKHAYQRVVQAGFSHQKTVVYAVFMNILLFLIIWVSNRLGFNKIYSLLISILLLGFVYWRIEKKKAFEKGS